MNPVEKYFNAEKAESLVFLSMGIISLLLSAYFLFKIKQPFFNGTSYVFIALALIQITVGATIYFRSPKDIVRVNTILKEAPHKIQTEELPRMKTVLKTFQLYFYFEAFLLLVGLFLHFYFTKNFLLSGIGFGLIIQCTFMLIADYFANSRGKIYTQFLENL
jgi:hypothetical protein